MTTAAFRMGDSIFNVVTPLASNFPLALIMCQRWRPSFGIGIDDFANGCPTVWRSWPVVSCCLAVWSGFHLPVGPGAPATYSIPVLAP